MRIRDRPEDFRVDEEPLYPASGEGTHTFVRVEKCLRTTEDVARVLAREAGVRPRDVGYAGRKDRVAVATQWLSVPGLDPEKARTLELPGVRVLEAVRHPHKLRTGQLRANRFEIVVRDVDAAAAATAEARLAAIVETGLPNRFGSQRFGRDGTNAEEGRALLRGEGVRGGRRAARFLLSALQAEVFNAVLSTRSLPPHELEEGDVAMVHESGGSFVVEDLAREAPRAAAFEISPTGPIFGTRVLEPAGEVGARERSLLAAHGVDPASWKPPRGLPLRGARRPLRVLPREVGFEHAGDAARVRFTLPPGSYATVLLETIFGALSEERGRQDRDAGDRPAVGDAV